ncbi:hypothetical protein [Acaryochloris sp. CCMEE 5410]|uniref:hypothetical protein n=1 Tax=Acaryochloris sp. CCMEE 5410 TaxID=310037 RepID=UPI000494065E|nr:hypothetical protein [Acaryochloris sp. CCMEE 5410]KAI9130184.1 hypothetical protein ON05_031665 [Acaryochloris sp. CCMEE 5410]
MESTIVALKPKPIPQTIPQPPKSVVSTPKLIAKTAFPKKAPEGTRPPKREPGHGELEERRRSVRRTTRPTKPESRPQTISPEVPPASRPQTPRISAELERRFRNLELSQKDLFEQATRTRGELEYLAIARNSAGQFWITVAEIGKPFMRETFATPEFCWECAVELEDMFDILQVIELRPPETIERIEEIVASHKNREYVAVSNSCQ